MLNISKNSISHKVRPQEYSVFKTVESKRTNKLFLKIIQWGSFLVLITSLLPWTQNVRTNGKLTTLDPSQRPQKIPSIISGRVEQWMVKEGDFVLKGDTIAKISEIKEDYFDNQLLDRTGNQIALKKQSAGSYAQKIQAQENQLRAIQENLALELNQAQLKINQQKLKLISDSLSYEAAQLDHSIASYQYNRMDSLFKKGLKSLVDLEKRKAKAQQAYSKLISDKNEWESGKNQLNSLYVELKNIQAKFNADYAKILSEKLSTETYKFETESSINKLENQYENYKVRRTYHAITAPQNGYITKLFVQGIGELVKEGEALISFMPHDYQFAVEIYVDPIDVPLINIGEHVRIQFDGWPAIVFSGWPGASYGTYGGEIYAIDQYISDNGKFRVLVKEDVRDYQWPNGIRVGGGAKAMVLLNDVPIWYEIWRNINGFPPEFYTPKTNKNHE